MAEIIKNSSGMLDRVICDFTGTECLQWYSVSDEVMGGVSESRFFVVMKVSVFFRESCRRLTAAGLHLCGPCSRKGISVGSAAFAFR